MQTYPLFVAELSGNHNGSYERARTLIKLAAEAGADAVKLQTYKPDTMTLNLDSFAISENHELWSNAKLYDLYQEAMTPWEWHESLFEYAKSLDIFAFSSPFDRSAIDFLESLNCPIYKIASLETGDFDLISYAASTGKPMIISTGANELAEIEEAVQTARDSGCRDLTLLLCTSAYPSKATDAHIRRIDLLREKFQAKVGISDHTLGIGVSIAGIAFGASVIEKHLTFSREEGGIDSQFSLEPLEFKMLVNEGKSAYESLGKFEWQIQDSEGESRSLRRSLFVSKDVKRGEVATRENVKSLRPNSGGPISRFNDILGRKFKEDYKAGTKATIEIVF